MIASKATILCLYEILKKYTDESHILSAEKIREKLKRFTMLIWNEEQSIEI